jgi:hypothetical protein
MTKRYAATMVHGLRASHWPFTTRLAIEPYVGVFSTES